MTRTWLVIHILASAFTVACLGAPASVNQDACHSQREKISIPPPVANSHRTISQIRFDPSTTLCAELLNREFVFLHVNDIPGNEIAHREARNAGKYSVRLGGDADSGGSRFRRFQAM